MFDLATIAARAPDDVAVRRAGETLRYAELMRRVAAKSRRWHDDGIRAGDRALLACGRDFETVINALAALELRCVVLPVSATTPPPALDQARHFFHPGWEIRDDTLRRDRAAPPRGDFPPALQALLSSGSTGRPKIVLRSHEQVSAGVRIIVEALGLSSADRILALVPLEHSYGFNSVMLAALSVGAEIVFPSSTHPRAVLREIEEQRVSVLPAPPHFLALTCGFYPSRSRALRNVRVCVGVGDLLGRETYQRFVETFEVALWQSYGLSEAGPVLLNRSGALDATSVALGKPYPEVAVELCDAEGDPVEDGTAGEIVVRSPAVATGYVDGAGGETKLRDGRCFTGDLGVRRCGEVWFAGRSKTFITRAGRKIDPREIEVTLCTHPCVADAMVWAAGADAPLAALVVARRTVRPEDLIAHCARLLPSYQVPRSIEFRDSLARNRMGKLERGRP